MPDGVAALLGPRILIVIDATIHSLGLADPFIASLHAAGSAVSLFDGVSPEPPDSNVEIAVGMARDMSATGVVGIGGGSAMDVAKVVALVAGSRQPLDQLYGVNVATGPRLPLALAPTTAGTGSEATPVAILVAGNAKKGVVSHHLLPDVAILDPELTVGLPPAVTAATGVDAMVHAIEAYTSASPNRNPVSQGLAQQALRLLGANIRRVVDDGYDRDARGAMLLGSFLAGQAFANSPVAAVHALAYPIGSRFHVAHGISTALMLPHVMRFNLPNAASDYASIAADIFPDLAETPLHERADAMIRAVAELISAIGLPTSLQALAIPEQSLPDMAAEAMQQTRLLINNPRPVTPEQALRIYQGAYR
ncbi:alcohol dehydrogenase [Acetobacter nitrogenifigens DSM 23921 = NBRC 105050]|uniref:Alcohol dehydrogenase 2 n=1 Tax=Acetobacter nitrogenifigens DSM 23921 = NBRC 105050 TaxID=1120919 RepID=A0A511XEU2_9PROT|nr:alcohol dehydrogenase [Acetobacter nitrogenifigens DSM 23921 = NBRC 105050]